MTALTLPAYAKLNLTLDILGKRADGYHDLRMVMQTVSLHDDVTVCLTDAPGVTCRVSGARLPCDERNLAVRAARAFAAATGQRVDGVDITLVKRIPSEAGMAGGSADAAAVLRALRALLLSTLSDAVLETIGAQVGSDVPFCIRGGTQLAEGRGEVLTVLPVAPRLYAAVCKPGFSISTPALFKRADDVMLTNRPDHTAMLAALRTGNVPALCAGVCNVFEQVLPDEQRACVDALKRALLENGACAAAMTGSGSVVYGLFEDEKVCRAACGAVQGAQTFCTVFV